MHPIIVQVATSSNTYSPKKKLIRQWAINALQAITQPTEVTLRIVDLDEMTLLNEGYRRKKGPTNVLSFPFNMPDGVDMDTPILGDVIICAPIVNQEAIDQQKAANAHWAHMVIHGVLHLQGYDHETEEEATLMESLEINLLKTQGFPNPYSK